MKLATVLWLAQLLPQPYADQACLATTVYLEARNQSELGQRAVAEVAATLGLPRQQVYARALALKDA